MATRFSLLLLTIQSMCALRPRPPQPICTQFSLSEGPVAARRLGPGRRAVEEKAPAASAVRLRNKRRVNIMLWLRSHAGCKARVAGAQQQKRWTVGGILHCFPALPRKWRKRMLEAMNANPLIVI